MIFVGQWGSLSQIKVDQMIEIIEKFEEIKLFICVFPSKQSDANY